MSADDARCEHSRLLLKRQIVTAKTAQSLTTTGLGIDTLIANILVQIYTILTVVGIELRG